MKTIYAFLTLIFFSQTTNFACAGIVIDDQRNIWNKSVLKVCWMVKGSSYWEHGSLTVRKNKTSSTERIFRKIIEESISREFVKERTGITFTGWSECPARILEATDSDIAVNLQKGDGGQASIGNTHWHGSFPVIELFYNTKSKLPLDPKKHTELTALHEFGHSVGLYHEDYLMPGKQFYNDMRARVTSAYDSSSIMSYQLLRRIENNGLMFSLYTNDNPFNNDSNVFAVESLSNGISQLYYRIGLSQGDMHALRCLYVYPESETCNPSFQPWEN